MPERETIELDQDDHAFIGAALEMARRQHPDKHAQQQAARLLKWLKGASSVKLYAWLHKPPAWDDQ